MRRPLVVVSLLALAACLSPPPSGAEETAIAVVLPPADAPLRIGLDVKVAGKPAQVAWDAFVTRLFRHFDRDEDLALNRAECQRIFPLPLPGKKQLAIDFEVADADGSGNVSMGEFAKYLHRGGVRAVMAVVEAPSIDDQRLATSWVAGLDGDDDQRITVSELRHASTWLRRLDLNEDEIWEPSELLVGAPAEDLAPHMALAHLDVGGGDAILRLNLGGQLAPSSLTAADGKPLLHVKAIESTSRDNWRNDQAGWLLVVDRSRVMPKMASAGDFLLAQFQAILADRTSLTRREIEQEPTLSGLVDLTAFADWNGDDRLTATELRDYIDLIAAALQSQVWVTITDRGGNVLPVIDRDNDGRLSYVEATLLSDVVTPTDQGKLPRVFQVSFGTAPVRTLGGLQIPAGSKRQATSVKSPSQGPPWFSALDKNRDGILSPREFIGPPAAFARLDANGDGLIDLREVGQ